MNMKKIMAILMLVSLVFCGCATTECIKYHIDPLVKKINNLESRIATLESKPEVPMAMKSPDIDDLKKELGEAKALARDAAKTAQDCCNKADAAALKAGAAAERAEAAASRAEEASKKSTKAFELQQKK